MRRPSCALLPVCAILLSGCDELDLLGVEVPLGALSRVELVHAPTVGQAATWACYEWVGADLCDFVGLDGRPAKADMTFSFDLAFDVSNPNVTLAVPLVQVALGMSLVDDTNLGSVCVSFCDPTDPACVPQASAVDACGVSEAATVETLEDLEDLAPTVEDLVDLAVDALEGDLNGQYRVLEPMSSSVVHVQFDLGVDPVVTLAEDLLVDAAFDLLEGRRVAVQVPYTVEGALLFDVPSMERFAVGFGPEAGEFVLEE